MTSPLTAFHLSIAQKHFALHLLSDRSQETSTNMVKSSV